MHVDCDETGTAVLSWTPASLAVKHRVYIGTSESDLQLAGEVTSPTFTTGKLSTHETYYWRIDEVDANYNVYTGDTWSFRPRRLAFPGAEGYGRFAQGGRDGYQPQERPYPRLTDLWSCRHGRSTYHSIRCQRTYRHGL